ncbi:MAG: transcription elongation factor GreB [Gammaproteobacteria bacterium]|nr:transcription elongation factor GreB [Gammaproteobacteria bacterium]
MGRWRPKLPPSSPYITAAGYAALQEEDKALWQKRAGVVKALAAAAAEGDRSENAEYIYRKKELAGIDRRIRYLQRRLPTLQIVREFANRDAVFFGAWVTLEQDTGDVVEYRIVGPDETDAAPEYISMDSPLSRALLKRRVDDEIKLDLNGNSVVYYVTGIRYPD